VSLSRYNRDYELIIEAESRAVTFRPPLRVSFSANKSIAGGLNRLDITIYNMKEDHRNAIAKDPEDSIYIPLKFSAGYEGNIEPLFRGSIHAATSRREGADLITEIECLDGGFDYQFSETDRVIASGGDQVGEVLKDMPHIERGAINPRPQLPRPKVMVGRSPRIIDKMIKDNERWFIENGKLHIIREDQVIGQFVPLVSAATGLLEAPTREQQRVTVKTRFNPAVISGGRFELRSELVPYMNAIYRAETIEFEGDWEGDAWDQTITGLPVTAPEVMNG